MSNKPTTKQLRVEKFQAPQRAWKKLRATLKSFEDEKYMKYNRVLGFGGFGLVQEWDILKPKKKVESSIAIKTVVNKKNRASVESLKREIYWTKRFTGSEHLIQLVDLDERVMNAANINDEFTYGEPNIAMERMGRGSLSLLLHRVTYAPEFNAQVPDNAEHFKLMEYIPNRTLWQMFLCLTRAIIGIGYPSTDADNRKGLSIRETTQGVANVFAPERIVHSDIDVGNIFIADPKDYPPDDEHPWAPIIKIADYGCMVHWNPDWSRREKGASVWGKESYKAPEQFAPRVFEKEPLGAPVNVYQIGNKIRILKDVPVETWGWRILPSPDYSVDEDWRNVDLELRELIGRCMADKIIERPTLAQLEQQILGRIADLAKQSEQKKTLNPESKEFIPGKTPKTTFNPGAQDFVPGEPKKPTFNPDAKEFVPGGKGNGLYRRRVPMGEVEPEWLLQKFYRDYFIEAWDDPDLYEDYWNKQTLPSYVSGEENGDGNDDNNEDGNGDNNGDGNGDGNEDNAVYSQDKSNSAL
ncbi:kinase-like protein [Xylaria longipes]|nr:kinase-like protein [Xylaria longipes]